MAERNTRLRASQIMNIRPSDVTASATNSASDGYVPSKAVGTDEWTWIDAGGSASALVKSVNQSGHGFSVGDVLRWEGGSGGADYAKAKADTVDNAEVIGIVSEVADVDNFTLLSSGYIDLGSGAGLSAGTVYFLSPSTAGLLTSTEPTTEGQVSKPLLIAISATEGYFINWRGAELTASGIDAIQDTDGDTKIQTEESADEDKIRFDTLGVERVIIDDSGKLGIGTSTPDELLHIEDSGANSTPAIKLENDTIAWKLILDGADSDILKLVETTDADASALEIAQGSQIITFTQFPLTPSSAPTSDYQLANKKYVDDNAGSGGWTKVAEVTWSTDGGIHNNGASGTPITIYSNIVADKFYKLIVWIDNPHSQSTNNFYPSVYFNGDTTNGNAVTYWQGGALGNGSVIADGIQLNGGEPQWRLDEICMAEMTFCRDRDDDTIVIAKGGSTLWDVSRNHFGVFDFDAKVDDTSNITSIQVGVQGGTSGAFDTSGRAILLEQN